LQGAADGCDGIEGANIYEVAELAGVSLATVSRVINPGVKVSAKTREKVLSAMEQLLSRSASANRWPASG
jgi:LacI family transcriptional regulator